MTRATAPVIAVALLVAATVLAASVVGTAVLVIDAPTESDRVTVSLSVDARTDRLRLTHGGGRPLDVSRLNFSVTVDGDSLAEQPPVPFFAAAGYRSGPTGPFNSETDLAWRAGERGSFRLASTNEPAIRAADTVTVTIRRDGGLVARARTRAA